LVVKGAIAATILVFTAYFLDEKVRELVNAQMIRIAALLGDPWGVRLAGFFDK